MKRSSWYAIALVSLGLLLVSGAWQAAGAAEEPEGQEVPLGATAQEAVAEYVEQVEPATQELDGELELNPVDEEGLDELAEGRDEEDPIFQKYAYLPGCASFGCPGGIDHMAAGTGTRNAGYGTIRLRGVPPTARKVSAFLYWSVIHQGPYPTNPTIYFNGFQRRGSVVNATAFPCWGPNSTHVTYRTWVFPFIVPGINSDYTVTGIASGLTTGQDPWVPFNTVFPLAQGASLVVLYTDKAIPRGTWVQIHHPQSTGFFGTLTYTHTLFRPITADSIRHTRIGSDGQVGGGQPNISSMTDERTFLAGPVPAPYTQIRGNGCYPAGSEDSDLNGTDGEPMNQLWDTHTMDVTGVIAPVAYSYRVQYTEPQGPIRDCVLPVVHVLTGR
ncbi:MAG: hypothetical protein PVG07_03605 [Acidobacteriota bacterium]|jgi:hypothetical protein